MVDVFDHVGGNVIEEFVGSREQCSRHFEAERFGGLDVEHVSYLVGACTGRSGWFLAFRMRVDVGRAASRYKAA